MQDNWQDFDRQIQSVLHDAGEKAPRRVWRAVSARLDSAAPAAIWWKWAVPALAAAAIVAGLFFTGIFDRGTSRPGEVQIVADASTTDTPVIPSVIDESADIRLLADADTAPEKAAAPHFRRPASNSVSEVPVHADEAGAEAAEDLEPAGAEESIKGGGESRKDEKADTQDVAAQWARIALEDASRTHNDIKISGLYAQGGLSGNDSNISYGGNGISRMAPGAGSPNAGISESGPSTYGVPFTVGLGARFRVNDKLSFGTGLDYSLLSRSFNGTYSGASNFEGTIFHSVQYIGIPVNVYYNLLKPSDSSFSIYAKAGVSADYCISNRYRLSDAAFTVIPDKAGGFQFAAVLGMGMEFRLSDKLGLYVDPSVRYWFHGGNQPKSVRTDKPFMFNVDAGLRFNL